MSAYMARRIMAMIPVLGLVLLIVFGLTRMIPGDPAVTLLGPGATNAQISALRHELRLDRPAALQFVDYVAGLARGDLGTSIRTGRPVTDALATRLPATMELAVMAFVLALTVGVPAGVLAARRPGGGVDCALQFCSLCGVSIPAFLLAFGLQYVFSAWLGWLPVAGRTSAFMIDDGRGGFLLLDSLLRCDVATFADLLAHIILPAMVLAAFLTAMLGRFLRNVMIETLSEDYIRTARAKGMKEGQILLAHALPNAAGPAIMILGVQFGDMLGGAILTETVFSWPGIGRYMFEAIRDRDYPVIQSTTLVFAIIFMTVSLGADVLSARIDPRLRRERAR
ncbi:dipeptide/oligopeptide/nickel ABC transporter permease [Ameyamaea chiangmaiensis NBRC 103196]|uniref:ABC transporter permease n=1 Tax=Ameyamaea chiangmaiensis TaxID=442969 RepID=A0A850P9K2_9PROT|nr:ABC transporter permease [Ameyamaea chiangmaiensis]MBS4076128.1 ABC transporter permease [Ameyamaea chiangmaiensis]NVN39643.1 ABC transporter permease [Ameyamaea chiangmaiensis]GBQ67123.1 dipeptide/oligopeptide/nickel ABC transporter permease [Ameyamaea chiangmaiensis NBRC 103196]